jgi:hypothetical protein
VAARISRSRPDPGAFRRPPRPQAVAGPVGRVRTLLDQPDQDLYAWIIGREPTPETFDGEVLDLIKSFRFFARTARTDLGHAEYAWTPETHRQGRRPPLRRRHAGGLRRPVMADAARARGGVSCFVASDHGRATAFMDALGFFAPDLEVLHFPSWDCLPTTAWGRRRPSPPSAWRR